MIQTISLVGFKSILNQTINLNRLTVLTGLNSSGKSSIIQALLMLEKASNRENSILLEGHGSVEEIKNTYIKDFIKISIANDAGKEFTVQIPINNPTENYHVVNSSIIDFPEIIYVSASRYGPRTSVPIYNDSFKRNRIGGNGENIFQAIQFYSDRLLQDKLIHKNSEGDTLLYNIRGWLSVVSPRVEFNFELNKTSDSSYSTFDEHRATNVGFGLSYALPVISALLIGTLIPNSLVIIENPEAHLHPKGQTEIAKLISLCAQSNTQVIIETHSDHVFDGIRIAAKSMEEFSEKVQLHWFELNERKITDIVSPNLDKNGRIDIWPTGLFDQFEINASKLL